MKTKKFLCGLLAVIFALGLLSGSVFAKEKREVTFIDNEGAYTVELDDGEITLHELPIANFDEGKEMFLGWFKDPGFNEPFDINEPVDKSITLYAKVILLPPFKDMVQDAKMMEAISYVYENEIMNGLEEDVFGPDETLTRAMFVTILYRAAGQPEFIYGEDFEDVDVNDYYINAVRWASVKGIVMGTSATTFEPNSPITREQMATILVRFAENYAGIKLDKYTGDTNTLSYDDIFDVQEYAKPAMHHCLALEAIIARNGRKIYPSANATRAEAALAIMVFDKLMENEFGTPTYDDISGKYVDATSQRATLDAESVNNEALKIKVAWSNSATETVIWEMTAAFDELGLLSYEDCVKKVVTTNENGSSETTVEYKDGEGFFAYTAGVLYWSGAAEKECTECVFKMEEDAPIGMPNPMVEVNVDALEKLLGTKLNIPKDIGAKFFIIDSKIAEMQFTKDDIKYCARAMAAKEFTDISGLHYIWDDTADCKVGSCAAKTMRYVGANSTIDVCLWYDADTGIMYSLSAEAKDLDGFDILGVIDTAYSSIK